MATLKFVLVPLAVVVVLGHFVSQLWSLNWFGDFPPRLLMRWRIECALRAKTDGLSIHQLRTRFPNWGEFALDRELTYLRDKQVIVQSGDRWQLTAPHEDG